MYLGWNSEQDLFLVYHHMMRVRWPVWQRPTNQIGTGSRNDSILWKISPNEQSHSDLRTKVQIESMTSLLQCTLDYVIVALLRSLVRCFITTLLGMVMRSPYANLGWPYKNGENYLLISTLLHMYSIYESTTGCKQKGIIGPRWQCGMVVLSWSFLFLFPFSFSSKSCPVVLHWPPKIYWQLK